MRNLLRLAPVLLLLVPASAAAQGARLSGTIVDPSNAVLPATTVQAAVTSGNEKTIRTVVTDATGRYQFDGLQPGSYSLTAVLPGFESVSVRVPMAGVDVERDIAMQVGSIEETISIAAGEPPRPPVRATAPPPSAAAPPPPRPGAVRVGGSLKPPRKLVNVAPLYPAALAAQHVGGQVVLNGIIGSDGVMRDITTVSAPDPELARAASEAFGQWEFTPTLLNGVPIETRIRGTFHFNAN
jgi:TonB family protein